MQEAVAAYEARIPVSLFIAPDLTQVRAAARSSRCRARAAHRPVLRRDAQARSRRSCRHRARAPCANHRRCDSARDSCRRRSRTRLSQRPSGARIAGVEELNIGQRHRRSCRADRHGTSRSRYDRAAATRRMTIHDKIEGFWRLLFMPWPAQATTPTSTAIAASSRCVSRRIVHPLNRARPEIAGQRPSRPGATSPVRSCRCRSSHACRHRAHRR